jgi:glycosyltransferase involved in cell wall biosynthesis
MITIGLVLANVPGGGIFQYSLSILEALNTLTDNKNRVTILYTDKSWESYLIKYKSFKIVYIKRNILSSLLAKIWLRMNLSSNFWRTYSHYFHPVSKALLTEHCDLWIFPSQDVYTYYAPVRALGVIHDLMHRYESRFPEVGSHRVYRTRENKYRNICTYSDGIIVDSLTGKHHVIESYSFPRDKIFILPYVAPPYVFKKHDSVDVQKKYGLPDKFLFYPAQFWKHKNHLNLILALKKVKEEISDVQLILVGSPKNNYKQIFKLVEDHNLNCNVRYLGYVPDNEMVMFYKHARALIMPTYFGPTNIPQLEAFAIGCPVATSNIYGVSEQVGDAAILFNPDSIEEISNAIKVLWLNDNICAELIEKGKKWTVHWNMQTFSEQLGNIISSSI